MHVFGSHLSNILTPNSDIDICILDVCESNSQTNVNPVNALFTLAPELRSSMDLTYLEVISNAKVPIIKLDCNIKNPNFNSNSNSNSNNNSNDNNNNSLINISVDICINNPSGLVTGAIIRHYIRQYPCLKYIITALKVFLSQRLLQETYTGMYVCMHTYMYVNVLICMRQLVIFHEPEQ